MENEQINFSFSEAQLSTRPRNSSTSSYTSYISNYNKRGNKI